MIQTITAVEACTAARKAYNEKRLLAQCVKVAPNRIEYGYEVDIKGTKFVCAIGACLTQSSLDAIEDTDSQLTTLETDRGGFKHIFDYAQGDYSILCDLQRTHDHWLMVRRERRGRERISSAKAKFLDVIQGVLEPEGIA